MDKNSSQQDKPSASESTRRADETSDPVSSLPLPRLLTVEALEAVTNYFWGTESPVLSEGDVQSLVETALTDIKANALDDGTLDWASRWIMDSLTGETDDRVIVFARNMAMTLKAAKQTSDTNIHPSTDEVGKSLSEMITMFPEDDVGIKVSHRSEEGYAHRCHDIEINDVSFTNAPTLDEAMAKIRQFKEEQKK